MNLSNRGIPRRIFVLGDNAGAARRIADGRSIEI